MTINPQAPTPVFLSCLNIPAQAPRPTNIAAATAPRTNSCFLFINIPILGEFGSDTSASCAETSIFAKGSLHSSIAQRYGLDMSRIFALAAHRYGNPNIRSVR